MRSATRKLSDDIGATSSAGSSPVLSDVGLPDEHGQDASLLGDVRLGGWRWTCTLSTLQLWTHKAWYLAPAPRHWLLRTSYDGVERFATPSLARGLAHDSSGIKYARVGGHYVRAGPEVGADPDAVDHALG